MSTGPYYPVFLDLRGRHCVVVGGGPVAARKARGLLKAAAQVTVISPKADATLRRLAAHRLVRWRRKRFGPADLDGAALVVAATSDTEVNEQVLVAASRRGVPVNVVDQPQRCTFIVPSVVRDGGLTVAISTAGASPALARYVRREIQRVVGSGYGRVLRWMKEARATVRGRVGCARQRRRILTALARPEVIAALLSAPGREGRQLLRRRLNVLLRGAGARRS